MIYLQLYLLFGVIYTYMLYDLAEEYYRNNVRKHPMAVKNLTEKDIKNVIKYGPLSLLITWPLSLLNLIIQLIIQLIKRNNK